MMNDLTIEKTCIEVRSCQLTPAGLCEVHSVKRRGKADGSLSPNLLNAIKGTLGPNISRINTHFILIFIYVYSIHIYVSHLYHIYICYIHTIFYYINFVCI